MTTFTSFLYLTWAILDAYVWIYKHGMSFTSFEQVKVGEEWCGEGEWLKGRDSLNFNKVNDDQCS